jgi:hypothetical protein
VKTAMIKSKMTKLITSLKVPMQVHRFERSKQI